MDTFSKNLIVLSEFNPFRLFGLFMCALLVQQLFSYLIEKLIWGEAFVHWIDPLVVLLLFGYYAVVVTRMANFLADQAMSDSQTGGSDE